MASLAVLAGHKCQKTQLHTTSKLTKLLCSDETEPELVSQKLTEWERVQRYPISDTGVLRHDQGNPLGKVMPTCDRPVSVGSLKELRSDRNREG